MLSGLYVMQWTGGKTLEDTENLWLHFKAKLDLRVYYIATQQFRSGDGAMILCVPWAGHVPTGATTSQLVILRPMATSHSSTAPRALVAQGRGCLIISTLYIEPPNESNKSRKFPPMVRYPRLQGPKKK